jgi:hypothetical protein
VPLLIWIESPGRAAFSARRSDASSLTVTTPPRAIDAMSVNSTATVTQCFIACYSFVAGTGRPICVTHRACDASADQKLSCAE